MNQNETESDVVRCLVHEFGIDRDKAIDLCEAQPMMTAQHVRQVASQIDRAKCVRFTSVLIAQVGKWRPPPPTPQGPPPPRPVEEISAVYEVPERWMAWWRGLGDRRRAWLIEQVEAIADCERIHRDQIRPWLDAGEDGGALEHRAARMALWLIDDADLHRGGREAIEAEQAECRRRVREFRRQMGWVANDEPDPAPAPGSAPTQQPEEAMA